MADAKLVAALVTGGLFAAIGGIGSLAVLVGALLGLVEWTAAGWILLVLFVGGAGLATYAGVALADEFTGGEGLTDRVDPHRLLELVD